jgi:hypothetical protein
VYEKMREQRKGLGLGLKEVETNRKIKRASKTIAFEGLEKGEAEREVGESREAFLREERAGDIWMNAVGVYVEGDGWSRA